MDFESGSGWWKGETTKVNSGQVRSEVEVEVEVEVEIRLPWSLGWAGARQWGGDGT